MSIRNYPSNPERDRAFAELTKVYHSEQEIYDFWVSHPELEVCNVGLRNAHKFAFSIRPERTPSARPNPKVCGFMITDFGGEGRSITPLERLQDLGYSKKEAIDKLLSWISNSDLSIDVQINVRRSAPLIDNTEKLPYSKKVVQSYLHNASAFYNSFKIVLDGFLRASSESEKITAQRLLMIGFSPKGEYEDIDRLMLFEQDEKGVPYGHYKYNRNANPKGKLRKNAKRVLLGSHLIARFGNDIIINEGHTDFCANISKQLSAVSSGSSTKRFSDEYLDLLAGKTLHDFPDLDVPGVIGATHRAIDIAKWNAKNAGIKPAIVHKVYLWSDWFKSSKLAEKIQNNAFSNSVVDKILKQAPVKNSEAFIGLKMLSDIQSAVLNNERKFDGDFPTNPNMFISNWALLNKAKKGMVKNEGYDFVDFHLENSQNPNYESFLAKFKFQ